MIDMNIPVIFQLLKELSTSNNREWFNTHREQYGNAQNEFGNSLAVVISRIPLFDESIHDVETKDCTYRIYWDIRFSEDKTPYKNHFGGYVSTKGKGSDHYGYYIHLQPGDCLLIGGSYYPPSPLLKALGQTVYDNIDEFRGIVEDPVFEQYLPVVGESFLKTALRDFPKDYPYLKYLQCKEYTVACNQLDSLFLASDFLDHTDDIFKQMKRFSDFVNYTTDDFEQPPIYN